MEEEPETNKVKGKIRTGDWELLKRQRSPLDQRFSTQIAPRPVFSTIQNFIGSFFNFIEGHDPFKIFHGPLPGRDPVVEKPWPRETYTINQMIPFIDTHT